MTDTVPGQEGHSTQTHAALDDVQGHPDTRQLPINRVGIKEVRHPVRVRGRSGGQPAIATVNLYVSLPHDIRGTHMSRMLEILHEREHEICVESIRDLLAQMAERLDSSSVELCMTFPFFVMKSAPRSGVQSFMDYRATLTGRRRDSTTEVWLSVVVPVTSLCPCSRKISAYGAHSQRSHITLTVRLHGPVWIEDLVELAESEASCDLYGILKRADEKYVTEHAYDHPKFVEDLVRDVATRLNMNERVSAYVVEAENFESIHNHSAYALIERDKTTDIRLDCKSQIPAAVPREFQVNTPR